jgi:hypothetical protein
MEILLWCKLTVLREGLKIILKGEQYPYQLEK